MPLPTIQELRQSRPEFDQLGYTDLDIVDWMHSRYQGMGSGSVADTARSMGMDIPDSDFANSWQQGWNNLKSKGAALGAAAVDTGRGYQDAYGNWVPLQNQAQADIQGYRQGLAQNTQNLAQFNTNPQSWEEVQVGSADKGIQDYMSHLLGVSGPEMAATAIPGMGAAGLTGRAGAGGMAAFSAGLPIGVGTMVGAQLDQSGQIDPATALAGGAGYSALNLLGAETALIGRMAGALPKVGGRLTTTGLYGAAGAATEMVGEVGQEALEIGATQAVDSEAPGVFSPEALARYKEAAIGAGLLGGPISAATGATVRQHQPSNLMDTSFQPPPFPAFDPTQAQPVPVPQQGQPIVGPAAPARFDPEQIAQAIPIEEITMETVPTEGIQVDEVTPEQIDFEAIPETAGRLPPDLQTRAPVIQRDAPLTIDNVGEAMAELVMSSETVKYSDADLDWANRHLVGKTVDEIASVDTKSPKRIALLEQINSVAPAPVAEAAPTTEGIQVQEIQPEQVTAAPAAPTIGEQVLAGLTERQRAVLDILVANPNAGNTEVAAAVEEETGKAVSRQSIGNTKRAIQKKIAAQAESLGMTVEQLQEVIAQEGAQQRAAEPVPARPDMTQQQLSPEDMATTEEQASAMGVVQSVGGSQGDIAATEGDVSVTTFGEDFNDARIRKIPSGYKWLAQNDPTSAQARKEASKFWTQERKGMEDSMPPFRQLTEEQKNRFTMAMRKDVRKGDNRNMIDSANEIVAEIQAPKEAKVPRETETVQETTQGISQETKVARAVWQQTVTDDGIDSRWESVSERQREIFQYEVENLAGKSGLTEQSIARNLKEIKKRVIMDGGAYYEGMYQRVPAQRGSQASQVTSWTKKFRDKLGSWVKVDIVQSVSELPKRVDGKKHPTDIAGTFVDGQVYLVADNIGTRAQALEVAAHEVVGHLGIESMLGESYFNDVVAEVQQLIADSDPAIMSTLETIRSRYVDNDGNYILTKRDEARELLAHLAQRNPNYGLVRKVIARLRMFLARLGLGSMTNAQLEHLLAESGSFVRTQLDGTATRSSQPAYHRSPIEEYHDMVMQYEAKSGGLREIVQKAVRGNEKYAKARGRYQQMMDKTLNEYKDPDKFREFVVAHAQRMSIINGRLKKGDRGRLPFQPFPTTGKNIADLYTAQGLLDFMTQGNKSALQLDKITPLSANIVYGEDPSVIEQYQIAFHIDQAVGGYPGLIGVLEVSPQGTDFTIASEQDIGVIQRHTTVPWKQQLTGVQIANAGAYLERKKLPSGTFEFVVKGPDISNVDFQDQWVDNAKDNNFALFKFSEKAAAKPGTVAPGFMHYARWKGVDGRDALIDLGKFAMRGQAVVQPDRRPPNLYSVRTTGANAGKETFVTQDRAEHMYMRVHAAESHRANIQTRMAGEIKRGWKAFTERVGPELLNLKGMIDVYGEKLPTLRTYYKSLGRMEQLQTHLAAEASAIATKWNALTDRDALNDLAMQATMDQIHPDVPFTDDLNKHLSKDKRLAHAKLQNAYNALSPEAQEVYALARDKMRADWDMRGDLYANVVTMAYKDAIDNAPNQAEKDKLNEQMKKAVEANRIKLSELKGPYFPLIRFGRYLAIFKSPRLADMEEQIAQAEDSATRKPLEAQLEVLKKKAEHYQVHSFETQTGRDRFISDNGTEGWRGTLADPADPKQKEITKIGMEKVKDYLSKNVDGTTAQSINTMLAELYVGSLPENHSLARELRRQGIEGANTNMLRAFAQSTEKMSFYLSRFKYRDVISENLIDLKAEAYDSGESDTQQVYQQVMKRYKADLDHHETPIQNFVARLSGIHHLASPAYWMVNATQPWIIGAPYAAARLGGMSPVVSEMRIAFTDAYKLIKATVKEDGSFAPLNPKSLKNEGEVGMLEYLIDHGKVDINITAELGALASSGVGTMDRLSNLMMWPAHQVETSNRVTLALAVWRLARRRGMSPDKALRLVEDTIIDTQIDYSNINAPYLMKTGVTPMGKLIFQFRKYQHAMVQLLALQARQALKGDKQARATLAYLVGTQVAMGGALSIPGSAAVFAVANLFLDDDDEDGDAETQMRNALTDWVGKEAADVAWKGLPAGVGMDLSRRTGMGDIFSPLPFLHMDGKTGEDLLGNLLVNSFGAWTSIPAGVIDSYKHFEDGNIWRGLESAIPVKGIRDLSKGIRYSADGLTTRSQNIGVSADGFSAWDITQRSLGLAPLQETDYYQARSIRAATEEAINDVRGDLLRDYAFARMAGDRETMRQLNGAITQFNSEHPDYRINGSAKRSAYKNRRDYNMVNEQGIAEPPGGNKKLRDLTRFAE